ncbi:hypothetical protein [Streptomyces beijiangensis]|uniref:RuvC-like resolvase n=1 Tax=Streptomyces beijiangensis TaxID=163361 RepID=A0A939FDM9_9ACTN|nr:hypothetical protein [Streptomyces beijiangensis]MBO0515472.1 hypothetical protein [Streptomyces beijiangensis]
MPDLTGPAPAPVAALYPLVVGLDVAIGTTGVAGADWTDHIRAKGKTLHERFAQQLDGVASFVRNADLVVIEGAAFSKARLQGMDQLSAMRWMVRHMLWRRGIPYAVVPPNSRIIYATGKARWAGEKGTQLKGRVRDAVAEQYGIECEGTARYDEADAFILAAMGLDWLGYALTSVPATHARALAGVEWPNQSVPAAC